MIFLYIFLTLTARKPTLYVRKRQILASKVVPRIVRSKIFVMKQKELGKAFMMIYFRIEINPLVSMIYTKPIRPLRIESKILSNILCFVEWFAGRNTTRFSV